MLKNDLKITIFGDICPQNCENPILFTLPKDELVVGNLECVLTDNPNPVKKAGPVLYVAESFAATLKKAGFYALSLANNHIRDCGDEGIRTTLLSCANNDILTFGAGDTIESASKPMIIEKNGLRIGFLSFAEKEFNFVQPGRAGASFFDPYESFDIISSLRKEVDALIVLYHGGIEHYIYPSPLLRKKCRKMIEAGANVVLCQHSHCIGTREQYLGGEILYGQGNSIFGYRKGNSSWNHGLLAHIVVSPSAVEVNYEVLETSSDGKVGIASPFVAEDILSRFEKESERISDDEFIASEWKSFCRKNASMYLALALGLGTNTNRLNRLLNNSLIRLLYSRRELNVTHNIIRCDSHAEVINTILEDYDY